MRKFFVRSLQVLAGLAILYCAIGLGLVFWPSGELFGGAEPVSAPWDEGHASEEPTASVDALEIRMRDGETLTASKLGVDAHTTILLMHGIAADSRLLRKAAGQLNEMTDAEVVTPDLRGHGKSGGRRFDVDYVGQYEDDLEDMLRFMERERPDNRIIVAGHSMGGGVAMRYALKHDAPVPHAYLLFAPNLGEGPTQRTDEGEGDSSAFTYFNFRRLIGLLMLNAIGIHALDDLPVLYFNRAPDRLDYSYRAVMSAQPVRPRTGDVALRAVKSPMLVVVGADDEVFVAEQFEPLVSANSDGETVVLPGLNHDGVVQDPAAFEAVAEWYERLPE